ncbi:MAG: phosphoribosylformylglycinamidine cyclo-ligase [Candidatus Moranbacteria bacterium]|nr:phosphoribosylformylglycinamidine cyclo-ligase [Candidatus Moranbacteria bacterium]
MADDDLYGDRGVSSSKSDVHEAIKHHDKGIFPGAFCKIIPDVLTGDSEYCLSLHADGAGTKSIAAYLAWKEGMPADIAWPGISQDSLIMNVDDLGCIGALGPFVVNQSIGRNKFLIPGEVIAAVINGCQNVCDMLTELGFPSALQTVFAGGETADVGDLVRTIMVDNSVVCRMRRDQVIDASHMVPGDVIVGFSSTGQAAWEDIPNAGLGSNGYTNARHDVLCPHYWVNFPEAFAPEVDPELVYRGKYRMSDKVPDSDFSIAAMLLSPTRTYLPLIELLLDRIPREHLHGIIHCSGGGQTKILKFGQPGNRYTKHNPFPVTPEFALLKSATGMTWRQMYKTYNMGHRLEVVLPSVYVSQCLDVARECGIAAQEVGAVLEPDTSGKRQVLIRDPDGNLCSYTEGED